MSNGKGSSYRPTNAKAYAEGWERIFGGKKKAPKTKTQSKRKGRNQ